MILPGQTFGHLIARERIPAQRHERWFFVCRCGKEVARFVHNVRQSQNPSCGCQAHVRDARDITRLRFGRLIALRRVGRTPQRQAIWEFECDCGKKVNRVLDTVYKYKKVSCGCAMRTQSALTTQHPGTYNSYKAMLARCQDPSHPFYKDYGGRGISVYFDWLGEGGFKNFLKDMGPRPVGKTLDRKENDKGYDPENCRWADGSVQRMNQRRMR